MRNLRRVVTESAHGDRDARAGEGSSVFFSIDPFLGRLERHGLGFRLGGNALVKWDDDTRIAPRVISGLPDFDHR
jgi:hypothetical protein